MNTKQQISQIEAEVQETSEVTPEQLANLKSKLMLAGEASGEFSIPFELAVSENVKAEGAKKATRVELGKLQAFLPSFADIGIEAEVEKIGEDKIPTYKNPTFQFLYECLLDKVLSALRQRVDVQKVSQSVKHVDADGKETETVEEKVSIGWKDGECPRTLEAIASGESAGEWRKALAELKADFKAFLEKASVSKAVIGTYLGMIENTSVIAGIVAGNPKAGTGLTSRLTAFLEGLLKDSPEKVQRYSKQSEKVLKAISESSTEAEAW